MRSNPKEFFLFDSKGALIDSFESGRELAEYLGIKPAKVYNHERIGRICDGKYYFSKDENFKPPKKSSYTRHGFGGLF